MAKARQRAANGVNKSEAIRSAAAALGPRARPRDIRSALKEQGIDVSAALVTNVLSRSAKSKRAGKRAAVVAGPRASQQNVSYPVLLQAKKLVQVAGSMDKAKRALDALATLI